MILKFLIYITVLIDRQIPDLDIDAGYRKLKMYIHPDDGDDNDDFIYLQCYEIVFMKLQPYFG